MPWYFLASNGAVTHGVGVKTGAASICHWQADAGGVTLWLDVSNGGAGVELGERRLEAATIVLRKGQAGESTRYNWDSVDRACRWQAQNRRPPAFSVGACSTAFVN
jgi:hypothetical protein